MRFSLALSLFLAVPLGAQRPASGRQPGREQRPVLERRFQERLGQIMRERLGLSDSQAERLQGVNRQFESKRREVMQEERVVRQGLRDALENEAAASNDEVAVLLDRAVRVQRQRVELFEAEQRELAQFLTPMQRAKYFGMLDQLRRRMDEMRSAREERGLGGASPMTPRRRMRPPQ